MDKIECIKIPDEDLQTIVKSFNVEGLEGSGAVKPAEKDEFNLFIDEKYKAFNKPSFLFIFLLSEAFKIINDGEYAVNSEKLIKNEKQKKIIELLNKFKDYVENYNKYKFEEMRMKLNELVRDFIMLFDKDTVNEIYKKVLTKLYENRDKNLPKKDNYKLFYDSEYPRITEPEARELINKLCKPIQKVIDTIKVEKVRNVDKIFEQNKNIKGIKAAAPKVATPFKGISSLNSNAHLMNSGLLTEQEIQNLRTQFISDDIKLNDYFEGDRVKITELNKTLDSYKKLADEFKASNDVQNKFILLSKLDVIRKNINKLNEELEHSKKYSQLIKEIKHIGIDMIKKLEEYIKFGLFKFENDKISRDELEKDSKLLHTVNLLADDYNALFSSFDTLTEGQKNTIKQNFNIFTLKVTFFFLSCNSFISFALFSPYCSTTILYSSSGIKYLLSL